MIQSNRFQQYLDRYVGIPLCGMLSLFRRRDSVSYTPKKILFIQLSALGDTILAVPTIRAIRQAFPDAELTMLASPTNLNYLANCPYIDKQLSFRMPMYRLFAVLRREQFDWAIDLEHWPRLSALLAYMSGAPVRIGFQTKGQYRHFLFTETVQHVQGRHEVRNFLDLATRLGCSTQELTLETWCGAAARTWVREVLVQEQVAPDVPFVVLHPEAGRRGEPRRRWLQESYVALADALIARYGVQLVLTGAPNEVHLSEAIAARTQQRAVVLAGQTDVNQLAALFSDAVLVVSGNCGPMHLAAATGTPVIGLHGPTNAAQWGPWSRDASIVRAALPCSPCLNLGFEYGCQALPDGTSPCMHTIKVATVLQECDRFLASDRLSIISS
ncbi:glycosyltransferase family 9 protein [Candidatus Poribacteria bacterium]|nr:glycosyltransferase family 9 protein [Candidatus Poribacteria bacterium]MYB02523.1 glycosyltransferase family 9 protein [Candidatus Poribacteria bacterium]